MKKLGRRNERKTTRLVCKALIVFILGSGITTPMLGAMVRSERTSQTAIPTSNTMVQVHRTTGEP
nr:hypothetical protein [Candidatus Njordarchaeota archaeon]